MKSMLLTAVMILSSSAFAQEVVIKQCSVKMELPESNKVVDMTMKVIANGKAFSAVITQTVDGITRSYDDVAEVIEEPVRTDVIVQSNLDDLDTDDLNQAESLIVHARALTEDPKFQGAFSTGIDLKKVRSAKLFTVGEKTNMGSSTIVEARDEQNQILGSFLGGFLVTPCK